MNNVRRILTPPSIPQVIFKCNPYILANILSQSSQSIILSFSFDKTSDSTNMKSCRLLITYPYILTFNSYFTPVFYCTVYNIIEFSVPCMFCALRDFSFFALPSFLQVIRLSLERVSQSLVSAAKQSPLQRIQCFRLP